MNVRFAGSGKNYTYINVPKDVYNDFINADSAGRFFNDYIKNDFEFTASPSDFVDSVRFNEEIMKVGMNHIHLFRLVTEKLVQHMLLQQHHHLDYPT
jgi:hypothetical protein